MKPKEKAKELVDKYLDDKVIGLILEETEAKKCAIIAVNLLLQSRVGYPYPDEVGAIVERGIFNQIDYPQKYWREVIQEIEEL